MARQRGELQNEIERVCDLFFWTLERGIVVGAVGYAAHATQSVWVSALYWLAQLFLLAAVYVKMRQTFFGELDKAQKEAATPEMSLALAPWSFAPIVAGFLLVSIVQGFVTIMASAVVN